MAQDFRSESGLYSLIQAQYDAALQNPPWVDPDSCDIDDRPKKKRRVTDRWFYEIVPGTGPVAQNADDISPKNIEPVSPMSQSNSLPATSYCTPAARRPPDSSPLSSPRSTTPPIPSDFRIEDSEMPSRETQTHSFASIAIPRSRSSRSGSSRSSSVFTRDDISKESLSLSDSSVPSCSATTDDITSITEAEQDRQFPSSPPCSNFEDAPKDGLPLLQSTSRALPNLKGRDLFDSMVWSDPFTTSIFYMFISSLREKIQNDVKSTTTTHKFIRTLRDGGRLVRNYTQNIDCLEERENLCTDLTLGPGSKTRFQARVLKEPRPTIVERGSALSGGVECVLLHGSLVKLRCGICGTLCSWETDDRQSTTLSGAAPDCPSCIDYSARRRGRGRRGLAVGRLRPDIVLYGEEHPNANLIAPLITHDLSVAPDFLLIMGTSLKVHGLKVMIKEFAKSVHVRGGLVVFVNRTRPPESTWGDFIDYWVEWDCDEWVLDLQRRRQDLWLPQGSHVEPKRKEFANNTKKEKASKFSRTPNSRPQATRDDKSNGVYHTFKILDALRRIEDSSGAISGRPIYWKNIAGSIVVPIKTEPRKQSRKSLPVSQKINRAGSSKKRKSCPSVLPHEKPSEDATEIWERLRKFAPGLKATPPDLGRIPLKDLHYNRDFPVHNLFMNINRSFADQSTNRFPWLDGLTLITHPPSGAKVPLHITKRIEKPAIEKTIVKSPVKARPITHAYGTRASAKVSEIIDPARPATLSERSNGCSTITVDVTPFQPWLLSRKPTTTSANFPGRPPIPSEAPGGDTTIVVDDSFSGSPLPSSFMGDTIAVAAPLYEEDEPLTSSLSDPITPSSQRIKRMGSIGAILSSPEDGSRSSASGKSVYYDAEEAQ